jgi:4-amino-4-deoxy-L-arabinose transferase-like glycosyltransferase
LLLWYSTESGSFRGQFLLGLCSLPIVLPGLIRMWRWAVEGSMLGVICGIVVSYFILLHMATGPLNRYMLPIYPLLCLAASSWALDLIGARSRVGLLQAERLAEIQH